MTMASWSDNCDSGIDQRFHFSHSHAAIAPTTRREIISGDPPFGKTTSNDCCCCCSRCCCGPSSSSITNHETTCCRESQEFEYDLLVADCRQQQQEQQLMCNPRCAVDRDGDDDDDSPPPLEDAADALSTTSLSSTSSSDLSLEENAEPNNNAGTDTIHSQSQQPCCVVQQHHMPTLQMLSSHGSLRRRECRDIVTDMPVRILPPSRSPATTTITTMAKTVHRPSTVLQHPRSLPEQEQQGHKLLSGTTLAGRSSLDEERAIPTAAPHTQARQQQQRTALQQLPSALKKKKLRGDVVVKKHVHGLWNHDGASFSAISALPDRLLMRIWDYLDWYDLQQTAAVCSQWHYLSRLPQYWTDIDASPFVHHVFEQVCQSQLQPSIVDQMSEMESIIRNDNQKQQHRRRTAVLDRTAAAIRTTQALFQRVQYQQASPHVKNQNQPQQHRHHHAGISSTRRTTVTYLSTPCRSLTIRNIHDRLHADHIPPSIMQSLNELVLTHFDTLTDTHVHVLMALSSSSSAALSSSSSIRNNNIRSSRSTMMEANSRRLGNATTSEAATMTTPVTSNGRYPSLTTPNKLRKLVLEDCPLLTNATIKTIAQYGNHLDLISLKGCPNIPAKAWISWNDTKQEQQQQLRSALSLFCPFSNNSSSYKPSALNKSNNNKYQHCHDHSNGPSSIQAMLSPTPLSHTTSTTPPPPPTTIPTTADSLQSLFAATHRPVRTTPTNNNNNNHTKRSVLSSSLQDMFAPPPSSTTSTSTTTVSVLTSSS